LVVARGAGVVAALFGVGVVAVGACFGTSAVGRGHGHEASAKLAWGRVMARRTILALAAAGGLALSLLPASSALAGSAFDQVLKDYQSDGQIDACSHSDKTLRDAQHQIPNDIEQHAHDFPEALSQALRERASEACDKSKGGGTGRTAAGGTGAPSGGAVGGGGGTSTAPAPSAKPGAAPTPPPVAKPAGGELAADGSASASASKADTPLPLVLLAIIGAILLLAGLFAWFARFMGWGFEGLEPTRHTWREAGWRTENTISEFADWLRFGR
jgi:hypothetical protein